LHQQSERKNVLREGRPVNEPNNVEHNIKLQVIKEIRGRQGLAMMKLLQIQVQLEVELHHRSHLRHHSLWMTTWFWMTWSRTSRRTTAMMEVLALLPSRVESPWKRRCRAQATL
jgi:hypothetical protein